MDHKEEVTPFKPLTWHIIIQFSPLYGLMATVRNSGKQPISREIHQLPDLENNLGPNDRRILPNELKIKSYLYNFEKVCPDPNGERRKLIDEGMKVKQLIVRFTYGQIHYRTLFVGSVSIGEWWVYRS